MARKVRTDSTTLYCSFCGKSQHDVRKLIAGPTVFICDECTIVCSDIIDEQADGSKFPISVSYGHSVDNLELSFVPGMLELLKQIYPNLNFAFGGLRPRGDGMYLSVIVGGTLPSNPSDVAELRERVRDLSTKLREAMKRLLSETDRRKRIESEFDRLKLELFPLVVRQLRDQGDIQTTGIQPLCVLALDIEGYSKAEARLRQARLNMLRGLVEPVLGDTSLVAMNTWGDAIVAGFEDVNVAAECACRFQRHLEVEAIPARIGLSFGDVYVEKNQLTQRPDMEGDAVIVAARLEPLADTGEVVADASVRHHSDFDMERFVVTEKTLKLSKSTPSSSVGETIAAYSLRLKKN